MGVIYTFTKYYNIPKPSVRYLLLSVPQFSGSSAEIGISSGLPLWAIILIVFGALIFVGIIIISFIYRKVLKNYNLVILLIKCLNININNLNV